MAVTSDNIRDLLNRPRGLNAATITELITVRTNEVNKFSRGSLYGVGDNAVRLTSRKALSKCWCALIALTSSLIPCRRITVKAREASTTAGSNNKLKRFNAGPTKP